LITLLGPSRRHNHSKGFIDMLANNGVTEAGTAHDAEIDYENEHRFAEHEHESQTEEEPEPWDAVEADRGAFGGGFSGRWR
jgi:hypothetical protein